MSKERRLGRGLEALLGRTASKSESETDNKTQSPPTENQEQNQSRQAIRRADAPHSLAGQVVQAERANLKKPPEVSPAAPSPAKPSLSESPASKDDRIEPDVVMVDVQLVERNPFQPRKDFGKEDLDALAASIDDHGMLQPLVVRRVDESYQLIAGERRLRAAQKAGLREVPVRVIEADNRRTTELAIVENLQRKDLNPLEKALSFRQYLQLHKCTQGELAKRLKVDRSTIANLIRLLELPELVQEDLRAGKLTQGHARSLLSLGDEKRQVEFAKRIQDEGLTVRATERMVQEALGTKSAAETKSKKPSESKPNRDHLEKLEQELRTALGTKVTLTHNAKGKGKMVIHFSSHDEFGRLKKQMTG